MAKVLTKAHLANVAGTWKITNCTRADWLQMLISSVNGWEDGICGISHPAVRMLCRVPQGQRYP